MKQRATLDLRTRISLKETELIRFRRRQRATLNLRKRIEEDADQVQREEKSNSKTYDENKKVDEKLSGPEMCDCSLGYPHSVNLHEESSLKNQ